MSDLAPPASDPAAAPAGAVLLFCHDDGDLGPEHLARQLEEAAAHHRPGSASQPN